MKIAAVAPILLVVMSVPALSQPAKSMDTDKGAVLVGAKDMTLYTYKNDKKGESACYDACAKNWPPFLADSGAKAEGAFTLVQRKDGAMQWAKDGMPLYYFVKDEKMGDAKGEGVKGVWDTARP